MNLDKSVKLKQQLYGEARRLVDMAAKTGQPQDELLAERETSFESLTEKAPAWLEAEARSYFAGYLDAAIGDHVRFLYLVDGKFYSVSASADTGYPSWSTLDDTSNLGRFGAMYWVTKDGPKVYFKIEES